MIWEWRLAFVLFFFLCWCSLGLLPWAIATVMVRGRGALIALPLALSAACAAGIAIPLLGQRDAAGFALSLVAAIIGGFVGTLGGLAFARRIAKPQPKPAPAIPIGGHRPAKPEEPTPNV